LEKINIESELNKEINDNNFYREKDNDDNFEKENFDDFEKFYNEMNIRLMNNTDIK
jgi:hypothetical protein